MRRKRLFRHALCAGGLLALFSCTSENGAEPSAPVPESGSEDAILRDVIFPDVRADADRGPDGSRGDAALGDARDVSWVDVRDGSSESDASLRDTRDVSVADVDPEADSPPTSRDAPPEVSDVGSDATRLPGCDVVTAHSRADRALADMLLAFWNGGSQYLDAAEPSNNQLTGYWTYAQAFDALLDGIERTRGRHFGGLLRSFYLGQEARGFSSDYYDDENWMALALLRAFDWTNERAYLDRAAALFADITDAWDSTSARPGGIWWDRAHTQKATASNAGPVITGARLALKTGDAAHLAFARRAYDHWRSTMVDPMTYQVFDHVNPDGTIVRWRFTYNEGLMIGAAAELYLATGDTRYWNDAHAFAAALVRDQTRPAAQGTVLFDGTNSSCTGDCAQFKGIGYRYLAALFRLDPNRREYRPALEGSAAALWSLARNPSGLFAIDWAGPALPTAITGQQSSAVMAQNLFAALCGGYPGDATVGYEAEDATLDRVALEATHLGFSGWGYAAAWAADGQSVDFAVQAPIAGNYRLIFDYAAAAGEASRSVLINGAVVLPRLVFPSTGSWDVWSAAGATVALRAGINSVMVRFDAASGSSQFLNLDRLRIEVAPAPSK
jgi:predicted alpha-1,6-mannanase (GH76 family)